MSSCLGACIHEFAIMQTQLVVPMGVLMMVLVLVLALLLLLVLLLRVVVLGVSVENSRGCC